MAKKRVKRKVQVKKPQKLPVSVQALLKYLGGTNVSIGGGGGGQRATIEQPFQQAPQVPQATQAPQFLSARQAPVGQVISQSPLARIIPQRPQVPVQSQIPVTTQLARLEPIKETPTKEPSSQAIEKLRAEVGEFRQQAGQVIVKFSKDISKLQAKTSTYHQDQDLDLSDNMASANQAKPIVREQGLILAPSVAPSAKRSLSVPSRAAEAQAISQGEYLAQEFIANVTNPDISPAVKLRGRPRLSEEQKQANKELKKQQKKELLSTAATDIFKEGVSATETLKSLTASLSEIKKPRTTKPKPAVNLGSLGALDPSSKIQLLAAGGGAAAAPTISKGQSLRELAQKK